MWGSSICGSVIFPRREHKRGSQQVCKLCQKCCDLSLREYYFYNIINPAIFPILFNFDYTNRDLSLQCVLRSILPFLLFQGYNYKFRCKMWKLTFSCLWCRYPLPLKDFWRWYNWQKLGGSLEWDWVGCLLANLSLSQPRQISWNGHENSNILLSMKNHNFDITV